MLIKFLFLFLITTVLGSSPKLSRTKRQTQCGISSIVRNRIIGGEDVIRGEWPWLVALMIKSEKNPAGKFFCGGVLISSTRVLTAAHCIQVKNVNGTQKKEDILVKLGAHDLSQIYESGATTAEVSHITIHPDWNAFHNRYDADIAVLTLKEEAHFTKYIRPICLPTPEVQSNEGFVAGWGRSESEDLLYELTPRQIETKTHTNENCFLESDVRKIASNRTFCAGEKNGKGPCTGDSGGGLYIKIKEVYYLKGLVSASLFENSTCNVMEYALYTDIQKLKGWIDNTVATPFNQHDSTCGAMRPIPVDNQLSREHFPWTVLVRLRKTTNDVYHTTGTLISDRHVVTTGMFIADFDFMKESVKPRKPEEFKVFFGIESLDDISSESVTFDEVQEVFLHPKLKISFPPTANVGILLLKSQIQRSPIISWVCLPESRFDVSRNRDKNMFEVGWGKDDTGSATKIRKASVMKTADQVKCKNDWGDYLKQTMGASEYYCATRKGPKFFCNSKTPMYMIEEDRWTLRGLFSFTMKHENGTCDLGKSEMYEDVGQYADWIKEMVRKGH